MLQGFGKIVAKKDCLEILCCSNSVLLILDEDEELELREPARQGRLFSNPFGILGHDSCTAEIENRNMTGVCYNEVECVVRGGTISGYCGPPAVKGACCVFATSDCETRVREKTFYFNNKSYPRNDLNPFQCQLKIKPLNDICWVGDTFGTKQASGF